MANSAVPIGERKTADSPAAMPITTSSRRSSSAWRVSVA